MVSYVVILLLLITCLMILKYKNNPQICLSLFLIGSTCFNNDLSLGPLHTTFLFELVLLICFLQNFTKYQKHNYFSFPFNGTLILFIVSILLVGLFDDRHTFSSSFINPFKYFVNTFSTLICAYCIGYDSKKNVEFKKTLVLLLIVEFAFGLFEMVFKFSPISIITAMVTGDHSTMILNLESNYGRFRIGSIQNMSFNYGYVSAIFGLVLLHYVSLSPKVNAKIVVFALITGAGGVIMSGSRSALLACVLSYFFLFVTCFNPGKILKIGLFSIPVILVVLSYTGDVFNDFFDSFIDGVTTGGKNSVGSSSSMRYDQWMAVLRYFSKAPIFGNGINYFVEVLGWGTDSYINTDLWGLEGLHYSVLLEQGIVGGIAHICLFGSIIIYFLSHRKKDSKEAYFGLSLMILFLSWAFLTGALGAWPFTMMFVALAIVNIKKKVHEKNDKTKRISNSYTGL